MSNYKPGTKEDPNAPWNEQPYEETRAVSIILDGELSLEYDRRFEPSDERVKKDMSLQIQHMAERLGLSVTNITFIDD